MKKIVFNLLVVWFLPLFAVAQDEQSDSTRLLSEVTIRAFEQNKTVSQSRIAVKIIDNNNSDRYNKSSLVNSFNTIAGVRMEERSPGSYRINIRGSSLRSPFGVRNVKVYWNDIPVTDPGGNTYFNQFAWNNFSSIEVFKGPASSLYGAGTGGLLIMNNMDRWQPGASLDYVAGSYGLQNIFASARFGEKENRNQLTYAHNESDGYRDQTSMRRDNFSWNSQLQLSDRQKISASILYTDMYYQTPGALTLTEYNNNPRAARPAGGGFPSAINAKAAIFQKNLVAGFNNVYSFTPSFKNSTTLYGAFSQIKNSAIRNYERRNEPSFGGRTTFTLHNAKETGTPWQLVAGGEFQEGFFNTLVSKNRNGNPDTVQTNDDIRYQAMSGFVQGDVTLDKWFIQGGVSINRTHVEFQRLSVYPVLAQERNYKNELAPRLAVVRKIGNDLSLAASVSRGFSPPTIAELLPSTGAISTDLEAEEGWNYEFTARHSLFHRALNLEATAFYFKLNNALVQRKDASNADYFINAGDVKQKGIELHGDYSYVPRGSRCIDILSLRADYTYSHFRYGSFIKGTDNFSGKQVPSVPSSSISLLADLSLKNGFYTNLTYYGAAKIYLNDANTAAADAYKLFGARLGWKNTWKRKLKTSIYAGVDNLFDEKYSLGNDINAAGGRYYNAALPRNYYAGISFQFIKMPRSI